MKFQRVLSVRNSQVSSNRSYRILLLLMLLVAIETPSSAASAAETMSATTSAARTEQCKEADNKEIFECDGFQCIASSNVCNGLADCDNGRDESVVVCGCQIDEFQCNETECIEKSRRCDLHDDCEDARDELDCELYICPSTHIKCDNHKCVPRDSQCNYRDDCQDNSDERSCDYRPCYGSEWRCRNSKCIAGSYLCDGNVDCYDGSDEIDCDRHVRCENGLYVSSAHKCDGWVDCVDSMTDELNCGACNPSTQFTCRNTRCVSLSNTCDGICDCETYCDDETFCGSKLTCLQADRYVCPYVWRCINSESVCNGVNDCWDSATGHDEEHCVVSEEACGALWCGSGKCIAGKPDCTQLVNCAASNGERCLAGARCAANGTEYQCRNGQCIKAKGRCDTRVDCLDMSDELDCADHVCPVGHRRCSLTGQCLHPDRWCDFIRDCLDGSDETSCQRKSCAAEEFRCKNSQCIPKSELCFTGRRPDGSTIGCLDNSHLNDCVSFSCPIGWFKCYRSYCIVSNAVCDGNIDCKATHNDEFNCPHPCPVLDERCFCVDVDMNCSHRNLKRIPDMRHEDGLHQIRFSGNLLNSTLNRHTFDGLIHVTFLDISNNSLNDLGQEYFVSLYRLTTLNLENNRINSLLNGTFYGLTNVNAIYLGGNYIEIIHPYAFLGLNSLKALDLSGQRIATIFPNAFFGLRSVFTLNLSSNRLLYLQQGTFNGLPKLRLLDLTRNKIEAIDDYVFRSLPSIQTIHTDEFRFCCLAPDGASCLPEPDEFSSCEDLMSNHVLRICLWILGTISLVGNSVVIFWRLRDSRDSKVHSFLITNLALGDLLMGVYLLLIAAVDLHFRGVYMVHDATWRRSALCRLAGFLSTCSSQICVLTLVVITVDRFVAIIFPFRFRRLRMLEARAVMASLWVGVFLAAALPLSDLGYFDGFYGRSGVCLALHITPDKPSGWEYSVFLFLALNLFLFLVIFSSYLWMFVVARQTRRAACRLTTTQLKSDRAMARRMTLIVLTDFCCWVPIILLGIVSLNGAQVPPQVYAWVAVFVLPLNAAVNPILYTISTAPFAGQAKGRVFRFRKSFINSLMTNDTKQTVVSVGGAGMAGGDDQQTEIHHLDHRTRDSTVSGRRHYQLTSYSRRGHDPAHRTIASDSPSTIQSLKSEITYNYESDYC